MTKTTLFLLISLAFNVGLVFWLISRSLLPDSEYVHIPEAAHPVESEVSSNAGTYLKLSNVQFLWSPAIQAFIRKGIIHAIPYAPGQVVNFDRPNSFLFHLKSGEVELETGVLAAIFSDIFDFPGSNLKDISLSIEPNNEIDSFPSGTEGSSEQPWSMQKRLIIEGRLRYGIWLSFRMTARLHLTPDGLIAIEAEKIHAIVPFARGLLSVAGLNLEKLIEVPTGKGIYIEENTIYTDHTRLFPHPYVRGQITSLQLQDSGLFLVFDSAEPISLPEPIDRTATHYLQLHSGKIQIGSLQIFATRLQMVDRTPNNPFEFYLSRYRSQLHQSHVQVRRDNSILIQMPDYSDLNR